MAKVKYYVRNYRSSAVSITIKAGSSSKKLEYVEKNTSVAANGRLPASGYKTKTLKTSCKHVTATDGSKSDTKKSTKVISKFHVFCHTDGTVSIKTYSSDNRPL